MKLWEEEKLTLEELASAKAVKLRNKDCYKTFIKWSKYLPFFIILCEITYSLLAYYEIPYTYIDYIGSVSILFIVHLFISSYLLKFCKWYRFTLWFIVLVNIIATYDTLVDIPISDLQILRIYLSLLGISLITYIKFIITKKSRT